MKEEYCLTLVKGDASLITYAGWLDEVVCLDTSCSNLGSEHDIVKGIDGIQRRFCKIKGVNPRLIESQITPRL